MGSQAGPGGAVLDIPWPEKPQEEARLGFPDPPLHQQEAWGHEDKTRSAVAAGGSNTCANVVRPRWLRLRAGVLLVSRARTGVGIPVGKPTPES